MNCFRTLLAASTCGALACTVLAQPVSKEQIKGLDEQVQDIKKDALAISSELAQLEEKLLYPSNTQLALFVTLVGDQSEHRDLEWLRQK